MTKKSLAYFSLSGSHKTLEGKSFYYKRSAKYSKERALKIWFQSNLSHVLARLGHHQGEHVKQQAETIKFYTKRCCHK